MRCIQPTPSLAFSLCPVGKTTAVRVAKSPLSAPAAGARAILEAAATLFAIEGFDAVSVADIAVKAGVSKANVFHHFPAKDDLYVAVVKEASAVHAEFAEQLYERPGRFEDKLYELIEFEIRNQIENHRTRQLIERAASETGHARVRKLARTVFQRNFTAWVRLFEQGRERGELDESLDPAATAIIVGGATNGFAKWREMLRELHDAGDIEGLEANARRITQTILKGIAR